MLISQRVAWLRLVWRGAHAVYLALVMYTATSGNIRLVELLDMGGFTCNDLLACRLKPCSPTPQPHHPADRLLHGLLLGVLWPHGGVPAVLPLPAVRLPRHEVSAAHTRISPCRTQLECSPAFRSRTVTAVCVLMRAVRCCAWPHATAMLRRCLTPPRGSVFHGLERISLR